MIGNIKFIISRNITFGAMIAILLFGQSCDLSTSYEPSRYSSQRLIEERKKKLEEYGKGNYNNDDY